jgi:hypothetical protein
VLVRSLGHAVELVELEGCGQSVKVFDHVGDREDTGGVVKLSNGQLWLLLSTLTRPAGAKDMAQEKRGGFHSRG